jgi:hypothetical protein
MAVEKKERQKSKRTERLTAFVDEDAMARIKYASFVTNRSLGEVLGDLIRENIKEPPEFESPFKK